MSAVLLGFVAAIVALGGIGADLDSQVGGWPSVGVRGVESSYQIDFPGRISINLTASGSQDVRSVRIFYRVGDAVARVYAYPRSFDNGAGLSAQFVVDTADGDFIPQGVDIEYNFVFTDSQGRDTESERFRFVYLDPRYDWDWHRYDDFTLYWHDRRESAVRRVGASVENRMAHVKRVLGLDGDYNFRAVVINDRLEARRSFPPVSQTSQDVSLYAGFALGDYGALVLAGLNQDGLVHELTHLMVDEAVESRLARVPAWLNEGVAMYFEPGGHRRDPEVRAALARGRLLRLKHMGAVPGRPADVRLFYAQSASIVRFMAGAYGEERLSNLFRDLGKGHGVQEALISNYGLNVEQLEAAWRASFSGRGSFFGSVDLGSFGTSAIIGGAVLVSASAFTVGWIKRLRKTEPTV